MPKTGVTKVHFDNLEFKIYHAEHKLYVIDHAYKKKYELIPSSRQSDFPFMTTPVEYEE